MEICTIGHLATTRQLAERGWTRGQRDALLVRVRRGVYRCAHLSGPIVSAARTGGALTCVSVLREWGVWAGHDRRVHVLVPPSSSGRRGRVRLHWEQPRFDMATPWRASGKQALWQAIRCLDDENAIAAMESAIHERLLSSVEVRELGSWAPRRLRALMPQLVENSGSGNETIARLRLVRAGYRVVTQGELPGVGHQDIVVEDCVGLEVDSTAWHGEGVRALDLERDLVSEGLGRPVLRILPHHIHDSWPSTLAVIDRMVRDAKAGDRNRG